MQTFRITLVRLRAFLCHFGFPFANAFDTIFRLNSFRSFSHKMIHRCNAAAMCYRFLPFAANMRSARLAITFRPTISSMEDQGASARPQLATNSFNQTVNWKQKYQMCMSNAANAGQVSDKDCKSMASKRNQKTLRVLEMRASSQRNFSN